MEHQMDVQYDPLTHLDQMIHKHVISSMIRVMFCRLFHAKPSAIIFLNHC